MFFLSPFYLYGPYAMANELVITRQTKVSTVFEARNNYLKVLGTLFLKGIYTLGWTLLLIVPGIIKSFSYSMTYFIIRENPEMGSDEAIEKSMKMMDGHKGELFVTLLLYGLLFLVVYFIFMVLKYFLGEWLGDRLKSNFQEFQKFQLHIQQHINFDLLMCIYLCIFLYV